MKKVFLVLLAIIGLILLTALVGPLIFKDEIKARVEKEINNNIKAEAYFGEFGLSVFRNFPNITASLHDFGIVGIEPFQGDTLASIGSFHIVLDIGSVLFGDQIKINRVELTKPELMLIVLEDGTANYDIAIESEEEVSPADTTETSFSVSVQSWEITDGHIAYYDLSSNMLTDIKGLNHEGSGDFNQDIFDMVTFTSIEKFTFNFDDIDYMSDKKIEADVTLNMNLLESKYTFLDNEFKINDFGFIVDGFVAMPQEAIDMDLNLKSDKNSFKSLISLIPGVYVEGYENIEATGNFQFDGNISGTYNDSTGQMPGYNINLMVDQGYIKYPEYPIPVEDIIINTTIKNETGQMQDGTVEVSKFSMNIDGKSFVANMWLKNFDNMQWKLSADGAIDLTTIMAMVDMPDMTLQGLIEADILTEGSMSAVEAEKYDQLPTSGNMKVTDFYFQSEDLPQGLTIATAATDFDPRQINISNFEGKIGSSDMKVTGQISNYLAYAMSDDEVLQGKMTLNSNQFNVNEWMTDDETEEVAEDTSELSVIEIPANIAFVFNASLQEVLYDNLTLKDMNGKMTVKNGILSLENLTFNTLGGEFGLTGSYNTQNLDNPLFDFTFDIQNLGFSEAFQNFNTVQAMAPVAQNLNGKFNTNFKLAGALQPDMMPNYSTLVGAGVISVINAAVTDSKIINGITSLTKLKNTDNVALKDMVLNAEVKDGQVFWDPFDVKLGNVESTILGSNSLDGGIDFLVKMDVPAGAIGSAVNQAISQLSGSNTPTSSNLKVNLAVGGTYNDPKVKLASTEAGESTTSQAKAALKERVQETKEELKAEAKEELDQRKEEVKDQLEKEGEKVEEKVKEEAKEEAEKAKDKLKKFFKGGK